MKRDLIIILLLNAAMVKPVVAQSHHADHTPPPAKPDELQAAHAGQHANPPENKTEARSSKPNDSIDIPTHWPTPTQTERAAAFPDLHGMRMQDHMDDDPVIWKFTMDRLETVNAESESALVWDGEWWMGRNFNRALIQFEGEREAGHTHEQSLGVFWQRAHSPWWNIQLGLRHEFCPGKSQSFFALGIEGKAHQMIELEATAWLGGNGHGGFELEADRKVLLTSRSYLLPRAAIEWQWRKDARRGIESGAQQLSLGARWHYEIRREFAPYLGLEWVDRFRAEGTTPRREWQWMAGVRVWF